MNDTKQPVSEKSPEYLAATLREVAETLDDVGKTIDARLGAWAEAAPEPEPEPAAEPEPPSVTLHYAITGTEYVLYSVSKISETHTTGAHIVGSGRIGSRAFTDAPLHVASTPAAIRALCAEAGVPCVGEPKTVQCSGWTWTHIRRVTVRARSNGTLDTTITGVSNSGSGKEFDLHSARTTPAQVVRLCELAGWPKPEVRMVLTYADGDPCEVDPCEDIGVEYDAHWHATSIAWVRRSRDNRYEHRIVREPVAVVEQMLAACKEGE